VALGQSEERTQRGIEQSTDRFWRAKLTPVPPGPANSF
jgi:hypothetical protein